MSDFWNHNNLEQDFVLSQNTLKFWKSTRKPKDVRFNGQKIPGYFATGNSYLDLMMFMSAIIMEIIGFFIVTQTASQPLISALFLLIIDFLAAFLVHMIVPIDNLLENARLIGNTEKEIDRKKIENKYRSKRISFWLGFFLLVLSIFFKLYFIIMNPSIGDTDPIIIMLFGSFLYALIFLIHLKFTGYFFSFVWFSHLKSKDYKKYVLNNTDFKIQTNIEKILILGNIYPEKNPLPNTRALSFHKINFNIYNGEADNPNFPYYELRLDGGGEFKYNGKIGDQLTKTEIELIQNNSARFYKISLPGILLDSDIIDFITPLSGNQQLEILPKLINFQMKEAGDEI